MSGTRLIRRLPSGLLAGLAITGLVLAVGLVSLVWTPRDPLAMDLAVRLMPPGPRALMGTDAYGRDVASMLMAGTRSALAVAAAAAGLGLLLGGPLGLVAAAMGGRADELVMRLNDLVFAFPALLLAVLLSAVLGPGALNAVIAIGVFNTPVFARVTRSAARGLWTRDFVAAARLAGRDRLAISVQHIVPNLAGGLAVQLAIQLSLAVAADAGLSFVGLGVQPPAPSWGRMLGEAQTLVGTAPWLALFPGAAIVITVLGLTLVGDGLARLFDPRRRETP
jgi:peptide/nickel transport system permease protein